MGNPVSNLDKIQAILNNRQRAAAKGAEGATPSAKPTPAAPAVNPTAVTKPQPVQRTTSAATIRARQEAKGVMPVGTEPEKPKGAWATVQTRQEAKGVQPVGTERTTGSFYSRAKVDQKIQASQKAIQNLTPLMDAKKKELGTADVAYKVSEGNLNAIIKEVEGLAQQYTVNPTEARAAMYDAAWKRYEQALQTYQGAQKNYNDTLGALQHMEGLYNEAVTEYWSGMQELDTWKGTVRSDAAIRMDLQNIRKEIQQQEQLEKTAALERARAQQMGGLTAGMGAMTQQPYAGYLSPNVSQREVSPQMQRLLDRQSLLQEELQWSDYFAQEAENERQRANARDVRTVQAELDAVKAQLANTQQAEKDAAFAEAGVTPQGMGALMPYGQKLPEQEQQGQYNQLRLDRKALQEQEKQLETELYWSNYNRYAPLAEAKDFEDKSRYVSTVNGTQADTLYEMVNKTRERPQEGKGGTGWNDYLREDEIKTFNYLYATEGREAAEGYIDWLMPELTKRQRTGTEERAREYATEHPFLASAESVVMAPARSLAYVVQAFDRANDGEIDEDSANYWALHRNSAIRDQVAKNIESSGKWGKAGSFAYQTAMSMADFLYSAAITGGTGWSMAIMGTGAAADTVLAAKDRGLSDGQAFALGTVAGLAEAVTEKVSLDTLLDASLLKDNTLKYVLKNMLAEGSEEVASDVINLMADVLIAQDRSQWQEAIDGYMRDGMSQSEAFGQAFKDQMVTMGLDFLGGAISGGVMSGGGVAIDQAQQWWGDRNQGAQQPGVTDIPRATESRTVGEEMTRQIMGKWADNPNPTVTVQPNAKVGKEVVDSAQRIANATGRNVVFYSKAPRGNNIQNGYFHDGVIYINSRSQNPMAQIFSHELTHSTEMADAYQDLSTLVFAQMRAKGANLDQLRKNIRDTYAQEGHPLADDAAVDKEIVADYVARNLLRNEQSIVSLVNENPSLGRKILNWIDKLLAKLGNEDAQARVFLTDARRIYANALGQSHAMAAQTQAEPQTVGEAMTRQIRANHGLEPEATAEVNEAAEETPLRGLQLPKLEEETPAEIQTMGQTPEEQRRQLDEQLRTGEITEEEYEENLDLMEAWELEKEAAGEVQYSIEKLPDGKKYVRADRQVIFGNDPDSWSEQVEDYINGSIRRGKDVQLIAENGDILMITATTAGKLADNHTGYGTTMENEDFLIKSNAAVHIDELAQVSTRGNTKADKNSRHAAFASRGWNYRTAYFMDFDGKYYQIQISVAQNESGNIVYNVGRIEERSFPTIYGSSANGGALGGKTSSKKSVPQRVDAVKQFSVSETTAETDTEEGTPVVTRQGLNYKARQYLAKAERKLLNQLGYKLGVSRMARREDLLPVLQEICDAYLENDTVSNEKVEELFDKAYEAGRVIEREFYDKYKHIKDHLRNTAVTISKQDQSDIADYSDFRKRAFGTLRIVNEGGLPVNTAYQELHGMAPELFPESITHPGDQMQKMYDVAKSIQVSEKTLNEAYGQDARDFYRDEFEQLLGDLVKEMRTVKRYAVDKAPAAEPEEAEEAESLEKIAQVWKNFKQARRATDKAMAKNLLTTSDEEKVGQLLKGKLKLEDLDPETDNVQGITEVYEAKREMEQYYAQLAKFKNRVKATRLSTADHYLETADTWKDKKAGILYARETMARNIYDIVKDRKLAGQIVRHYFTPVQVAQAEATRFKNAYRSKVAALKLDTKVRSGNIVSEAHAVQMYGEAMDNIRMLEKMRFGMNTRDGKNLQEWQAVVRDLWEQNPNLDQSKIRNAVEEFRKIYDELLQKMNEVRMANGYEPVNYRQGYFPHFQPEGDGIAALFGKALGISMGVDTLPTTINGLTHTFKPGIQWFGNAQERLGFNTAYDAVKGFDKYIEGVASVVHQTENIQNLRALATQVRYRTSDEAIRRDVDAIKNDDSKSEEDKRRAIQEIYDNRPCSLSNFVGELDEYTNLLANKKSRFSRQSESDWGRRYYRFINNVSSRVSMNMINGNLSSATTNFIPLTQAMGRIGVRQTLKGMYEAQQAIFRKDGSMVEASTFLTNRRGSDPLVKVWNEKVADVLGWPMETIDHFVSESIVRAAYNKNLKDGLSETEALYQADIMAGSIMADRSKGALPTVFERKNLMTKLFTGFQVEVNNQFSEVFKDMPREYAEKSKLALALCLLKYFLAAFLINELEEKVKGRRSALDPIGIGKQFVEDFQKAGIGEASTNLIVDTVGSLPFSTLASIGLTQFGFESDSGRVPIQSAIPNLVSLGNAIANNDWSSERRWEAAGEELAKPLTYLASPFGGGNQFAKTIKGLKAYIEGGSYKIEDVVHKDEDGNVIGVTGEKAMQYPVFKEDGTMNDFWDVVRASIFGKSALDEAQEWVGSNFKGLTAEQTAVYQDMLDAGVRDRDAFSLINAIKGAQKTEDKSRTAVQRELLRKSNVSGDGKALVYYGMILDDDSKERELMDRMADDGADMWEVSSVLMDIHDTEEGKTGKLTRVMNSRISAEEKAAFVEYVMGSDLETEAGKPTQYAKFLYSLENGMSVDEYLEVYTSGGNVDQYLEMMYEGVDHDAAQYYAEEAEELVSLENKGKVEDIQKWRVAIDASQSEEQQMTMLYILMDDSQYQKVEIAYSYGVKPGDYVRLQELLPEYDLDHSGGYKQTEIQAAINGLAQETKLTDTEKAALWQLVTGSTSSKKNPFSKKVGQKIIDEKKAAKDAPKEDADDISFADAVMQQLLGR